MTAHPLGAMALVDVAVEAGADAVKFQVFRAAELASASAGTAAYQQDAGQHSQRAMLEKLELSEAALERIATHCRLRSIEFLATPFSLPDMNRLGVLGVPALKIASTDLDNTPLLHKAVATEIAVDCLDRSGHGRGNSVGCRAAVFVGSRTTADPIALHQSLPDSAGSRQSACDSRHAE